MLEVTEQRPMHNEYVNIMNNCHQCPWLAFLNFTANFCQHCKQETARSMVRCYSA